MPQWDRSDAQLLLPSLARITNRDEIDVARAGNHCAQRGESFGDARDAGRWRPRWMRGWKRSSYK
jgi:hypothetical protein